MTTSFKQEIVHLSFSSIGGAGTVAKQLNAELVRRGVSSSHLSAIDSTIRATPFAAPGETVAALIDGFLIKRQSFQNPISLVRSWPSQQDIDKIPEGAIVHIHWAPGAFGSRFEDLERRASGIVVTLHDFLPITGACHYPSDCRKFQESCDSCPAVKAVFHHEVKERRRLREQMFNSPKVLFTAPTKSAAFFAKSNPALDKPVHVIQNPVGEQFRIIPRHDTPLNSGLNIAIIAADLSDRRKGVVGLLNQLREFSLIRPIHVHLVGSGSDGLPDADWITKHGSLSASRLTGVLSLCDLHLLGSIEEVAGLVVCEAAACGVPTLARKGTGAEDLINILGFGDVFEDHSLKDALIEFNELSISSKLQLSKLSEVHFGVKHVADQMLELYRVF